MDGSNLRMTYQDKIDAALAVLAELGVSGRFDCACVLGTGLGRIADAMTETVTIPYATIPHFPVSGVSGHQGQLLAGRIEGKRVLIFQGRAHYYETGDAAAMRVPIGVVARLGEPPLILTNASGSVKLDYRPGSHIIVSDHINYSGLNPLIGETDERRFVPMHNAYDMRLRKKLRLAALAAGVTVNEGVYMWFSGPSFETPAEVRMARTLGADVVGMSSVPEVILARFYGLHVAAISLVTNIASGVQVAHAAHDHKDTKALAAGAAPTLRRLLTTFLKGLDDV
jgi:purine-nucleoside phosphorylase